MNIIAIAIIGFILLEATNVVASTFSPVQNTRTAWEFSGPGKNQSKTARSMALSDTWSIGSPGQCLSSSCC